MKVKCFGCDALIEAGDSYAVADAFVGHGQESHTWSRRLAWGLALLSDSGLAGRMKTAPLDLIR